MRVALVHDWLTGMRGGERVLAEIAKIFPGAPIYTLVHRRGSVDPELEQHPIHTSWLQGLSLGGRRWRHLLPLMPAAIENFSIPDVELVISTNSCVAKGVIPPPGAYHICYVHTPMRYAWDQRQVYLDTMPRVVHPIVQMRLARLRQWDMVSAARVDRLIANSRLVAWRIKHYWNRLAEVIPPPIDTDYFTAEDTKRSERLLTVAALVPYKRVEVAIEVAKRMGRPLDVIGTGPGLRHLQRIAGSNVRFHGWVTRDELRTAYRNAAALIVPNIEDFGMVAVEALSCGTPVVGLNSSGTADVVRPGIDGELADHTSVESVLEATRKVLDSSWHGQTLRQRSEVFSREQFLVRFKFLLDRLGFGRVLL